MIKEYVSKPVEAVQLTEDVAFQMFQDKVTVFGLHIGGTWYPDKGTVGSCAIQFKNKYDLKHTVVRVGDWIVKETNGNFSKYTDGEFRAAFDEYDPNARSVPAIGY